MLIRPAIDDTDPIRYRRPTPDGQFSGNILDEAMRTGTAGTVDKLPPQPPAMVRQRCLLRTALTCFDLTA